jgi:hypothetical protein
MIEVYLRRYDWFVLKPLWLVLLGLAVVFFLQSHWFIAVAMLALAVFGIGSAGAALHRERAATELMAGYPHRSTLTGDPPASLDYETSFRLGKVTMRLAIVLAIAALALALHFGLRWYLALLLAGLVAWLGPMVLLLPISLAVRPSGRSSR